MLTPDKVKLTPGEAGLPHDEVVLTPSEARLTHAPACLPAADQLLPKLKALSLELAIYYILFAGALR